MTANRKDGSNQGHLVSPIQINPDHRWLLGQQFARVGIPHPHSNGVALGHARLWGKASS